MNQNYNANNISFKEGTVIFCGPGNIKLVTLKTILALSSADVVIYDSLINRNIKNCKKQSNYFCR